jgi:hypothetical protein
MPSKSSGTVTVMHIKKKSNEDEGFLALRVIDIKDKLTKMIIIVYVM